MVVVVVVVVEVVDVDHSIFSFAQYIKTTVVSVWVGGVGCVYKVLLRQTQLQLRLTSFINHIIKTLIILTGKPQCRTTQRIPEKNGAKTCLAEFKVDAHKMRLSIF